MKSKCKALLFNVLLLSAVGCATTVDPIPDNYVGGTATVTDSFVAQSKFKANVFYLESVNGTRVQNAEDASRNASSGNGLKLTANGASRQVPVYPLTMRLVGAVQHGAPVGSLFNMGANYHVEGDVSLTLKAGETYVVAGQLSKNYSGVWLEDSSGTIVSKRVEIKGENYNPAVDGVVQRRRPSAKNGPLSREEIFLGIRSGQTDDLVISKLGVPDKTTLNESSFMSDRPDTVTYYYNELGSVIFVKPNLGIFRRSEENPLEVIRTIPELKADGDIDSIRAQLDAASGPGLQQLAKNYFAQSSHSVEVLDFFANEVWQNRNTEGDYSTDAMAYLCRTLGKSQNARYRTILQQVADLAGSKKLRRYALNSLKQLPVNDAPQFRAGRG